ncbi:hypothetical protein [Bradyrhizobium sp. CB2312]|uniref:hypothetical protein n=1 Tax=Bradyrhizobium sp. CB2312 TaxID=3039155 RepID=UPI0024B0930B|nr:hypothetical protein [Bradyrhizobium sp. CB2312]WFU75585.1 hypothetical protein QA642_17115 [Bradyrhizobium sp. CB2312]
MKFDEKERALLTDAGFVVADNNRAAYVKATIVVAAHDDESFWLTLSLPNETRIACSVPRDQMTLAIRGGFARRQSGLQ